MKKYLKQAWQLFRDSLHFFHQGLQENLFKAHLKSFFTGISSHLGKFHFQLKKMNRQRIQHANPNHHQIKGLHSLLPEAKNYSYSILIELNQPSPEEFKSCLSSACIQTAPVFEILIGCKSAIGKENLKIIRDQQKTFAHIKLLDQAQNNNTPIYNQLAKKASGKYLLFVKDCDWIRYDLLYRYEQFLRTLPNPENTLLNCLKNEISEKNYFVPGTCSAQKKTHFPYIFRGDFELEGALISKSLWDKIGGIAEKSIGAEIEDLFLRLDLAAADFTQIPFCLYSRRQKPSRTASDLPAFIAALRAYTSQKQLHWKFEKGYLSNAVRCVPQPKHQHKIHVVVPFKDQKELTLRCVGSVLAQKGMDLVLTAIDNASKDASVGDAIRQKGCEVIYIDEPFNYSRLNNFAVSNTVAGKDCDLILFLNNDVEMDHKALEEMILWIDQPSIGMVGARLHYPNGQLQHGGLMLNEHHLPEQLWWNHREKYLSFDQMNETKIHGIVDAVTAACALIKKEIFLKIGGFDEIWYPISYSDTHLAFKLKKMGLNCFYTPYAFGTHHESVTRKEAIDEIEASRWLHQLVHR